MQAGHIQDLFSMSSEETLPGEVARGDGMDTRQSWEKKDHVPSCSLKAGPKFTGEFPDVVVGMPGYPLAFRHARVNKRL